MRPIYIPILVLTLAACGRETTTPSSEFETFELPADLIAENVRTVLTNSGIRTAVLVSDTAYIFEEDRSHELRGVNMTFFAENGAEAGTLRSNAGNYNMGTGVFVARGDVLLITEGPSGERRLETELLRYDVRGDSISTDRDFVLHDDGQVSRGTSFKSDAQFRTWEVVGARTEGAVESTGSF
ncbi:MAG: LPS export ABC transporter periplasmic protein LptC [Gemmatimonadota bacterium]